MMQNHAVQLMLSFSNFTTLMQKVHVHVKYILLFLMHQSLVITGPSGPGNSGDIDFPLCKVQIYAQHCGNILMIKAMSKALLKSRQVMQLFVECLDSLHLISNTSTWTYAPV